MGGFVRECKDFVAVDVGRSDRLRVHEPGQRIVSYSRPAFFWGSQETLTGENFREM